MTTIYIARNQYAIRHGKLRFMCCRVDDTWELYDQAAGYMTVHTVKAGGSLPPEAMEAWIGENYPP